MCCWLMHGIDGDGMKDDFAVRAARAWKVSKSLSGGHLTARENWMDAVPKLQNETLKIDLLGPKT